MEIVNRDEIYPRAEFVRENFRNDNTDSDVIGFAATYLYQPMNESTS